MKNLTLVSQGTTELREIVHVLACHVGDHSLFLYIYRNWFDRIIKIEQSRNHNSFLEPFTLVELELFGNRDVKSLFNDYMAEYNRLYMDARGFGLSDWAGCKDRKGYNKYDIVNHYIDILEKELRVW